MHHAIETMKLITVTVTLFLINSIKDMKKINQLSELSEMYMKLTKIKIKNMEPIQNITK